jgi:hypothetical protein
VCEHPGFRRVSVCLGSLAAFMRAVLLVGVFKQRWNWPGCDAAGGGGLPIPRGGTARRREGRGCLPAAKQCEATTSNHW